MGRFGIDVARTKMETAFFELLASFLLGDLPWGLVPEREPVQVPVQVPVRVLLLPLPQCIAVAHDRQILCTAFLLNLGVFGYECKNWGQITKFVVGWKTESSEGESQPTAKPTQRQPKQPKKKNDKNRQPKNWARNLDWLAG